MGWGALRLNRSFFGRAGSTSQAAGIGRGKDLVTTTVVDHVQVSAIDARLFDTESRESDPLEGIPGLHPRWIAGTLVERRTSGKGGQFVTRVLTYRTGDRNPYCVITQAFFWFNWTHPRDATGSFSGSIAGSRGDEGARTRIST